MENTENVKLIECLCVSGTKLIIGCELPDRKSNLVLDIWGYWQKVKECDADHIKLFIINQSRIIYRDYIVELSDELLATIIRIFVKMVNNWIEVNDFIMGVDPEFTKTQLLEAE